jgi:predicted dehydrogenase
LLAREGLCEIVAACDPQLAALPESWNEPFLSQTRLFRSHEQMFRGGPLDYIVIVSPLHLHEEHCLRALAAGGAFVYLEKAPVPTFAQLLNLLEQPGADRVAVGFQMLEAPAIRGLKQQLLDGKSGKIREIWASGLWPRSTSYYQRTNWAGKTMLDGRPVLDGPLTNALAHLVQNVFFLAGDAIGECARPLTATGSFARARPIQSYDFGWIKGVMENGIVFNILAGHCSREFVPWKVVVRTDRGDYAVGEEDLPSGDTLLVESHRALLHSRRENRRATCRLSDCLGYSMATSTAWLSSSGIQDIPAAEVTMDGTETDAIYHVESIHRLISSLRAEKSSGPVKPDWLHWNPEANCRETLAAASNRSCEQFCR